MADYTGMTVKVELKQPPGIQLFGIVKEVVAGQTLTLYDGTSKNPFFENISDIVQSSSLRPASDGSISLCKALRLRISRSFSIFLL